MPVNKIEAALEDLRQGKMLILVDDEDRENEGDLVIAADKVTPEAINFMAKDGGGLVRTGQTEGSVDLVRLAGSEPTCVTTASVLRSSGIWGLKSFVC